MEWLSAEEKTRSMMPYLLDLPPLDSTEQYTQSVKITEVKDDNTPKKVIIKKSAPETTTKEIETDK